MTDAKRDNNQVPVITGVDSSDGVTVLPVKANPDNHRLIFEDGIGGSDPGANDARHDNNGVPTLLATSNADGTTPVPIFVNSATGAILIKST